MLVRNWTPLRSFALLLVLLSSSVRAQSGLEPAGMAAYTETARDIYLAALLVPAGSSLDNVYLAPVDCVHPSLSTCVWLQPLAHLRSVQLPSRALRSFRGSKGVADIDHPLVALHDQQETRQQLPPGQSARCLRGIDAWARGPPGICLASCPSAWAATSSATAVVELDTAID